MNLHVGDSHLKGLGCVLELASLGCGIKIPSYDTRRWLAHLFASCGGNALCHYPKHSCLWLSIRKLPCAAQTAMCKRVFQSNVPTVFHALLSALQDSVLALIHIRIQLQNGTKHQKHNTLT
jgi:hypothetical protein